ncbi:copper chaperone PCu(A)C [Campylobacter curvus]|uniref:copper chaperone PCu(A)C n=1 Tax=Campylobacter curvus TaxID=200 RepID=UPI00146FFCC7|nr:copper chaperone PCu(A)C [Campylobacter curvus]
MKKFVLAAIFAAFGGMSLFAGDISIDNIRARDTKPGTNNSAIFMNIKNSSNADIKLVGVKSSVCKSTEMHTHKMADGMMAMVQVKDIDVPKNGEVMLAPEGLHVMLIDLNKPLKDGDKVDLELKFSNGETMKFDSINVTKNFK